MVLVRIAKDVTNVLHHVHAQVDEEGCQSAELLVVVVALPGADWQRVLFL